MKIVRIGVIGCANILQKHIFDAVKNIQNGKIITISSRDAKKAREWAKKFNCEYEKSYDDVLKRKDIDAVYIPLPIGLHRKWVIKAAKAKKHVICEKSLAKSLSSVKKMVKICKQNKVILYENFMCDYHPQHQKVISLISKDQIGEISLFRGYFGFPPLEKNNIRYNRSLGGGSLNDTGTYPVFMSKKIFKSNPLYVTCKLFYDKKSKVDIQGSAILEFSEKKFAFISFGFNNFYQNNYSVWGSKGLINVNRAYSIPANMKPQIDLLKQNINKGVNIPATNQFSLIFKDFCKKILDNKKVDYSSLIDQAEVMEALRISARKNKKVRVKDIK